MFDRVPTGARYVAGGDLYDTIVFWRPVPILAPGMAFSQVLVVMATQTITNSDYGVQIAEGGTTLGRQPVVTYINEVPPAPIPLPFIVNHGAEAAWRYNNQPDVMQSNPTFNPAQKIYLPLVAR